MQNPGNGSGSPAGAPLRAASTVLRAKTVLGITPRDAPRMPEPALERPARVSDAPPARLSDPPVPLLPHELPDISEIRITDRESYRVERVLGRGGFGVVYRGTHLVKSSYQEDEFVIEDPVALKVISFDAVEMMADPGGAEAAKMKLNAKFETEVRLAKKLKHPNIVRIETYAQLEDGRPFYVMELLNGMDLAAMQNQAEQESGSRALPWDRVRGVMIQLCSALDAAHTYSEKGGKKPIIHRDIKPENVFVETGSDGEWHIKVLDFGLARVMAPSGSDSGRKGERVGGSPWYMSPEQAWEDTGTVVDERSDIWSAGATMYELLTGRPPFDFEILEQADGQGSDDYFRYRVEKWAEIRDRLWHEAPRPFSDFGIVTAAIPAGVEDIVFRCLQKGKEARFQSVAGMRQAIAALGAAGGNGTPNPVPAPAAGPAPFEGGSGAMPQAAASAGADVGTSEAPTLELPLGRSAGHRGGRISRWLIAAAVAGSVAAAGIGAYHLWAGRPDAGRAGQMAPKHAPSAVMQADGAQRRPGIPIVTSLPAPMAPEGLAVAGAGALKGTAGAAAEPEATPDAPGPATSAREHTITFNVGMGGVQAYLGGKPICRSDGDGRCRVTLPEGSGAVRILFRKSGYSDAHKSVVPDGDREISIGLERPKHARPAGPKKDPGRTPRITSE
jgi:eukaryotic-like serine/threonine-protein kinase